MSAYIDALLNYANFTGRTSRYSFWMFTLVDFIILFMLNLFDINGFIIIYQLILFLPRLSACVRRMHDTNHSGFWVLCPIYGWIILCFPSVCKNS